MDFEKIEAPSPKELFIRQIVRMILAGKLAPGDKLPPERELAESMGITRSVVHSGIEELAHMRFVNIEPRRGVRIADYARNGDFNTLTAIAQYNIGELDKNTRISMVEMRNAVVGGALIRLAKSAKPDTLDTLRRFIAEHKDISNATNTQTAEHMMKFNLLLTRLSGNTLFPLLMNSFAEANIDIWQRCVAFWGRDVILQQENMLVDMIADGKGHEAAMYIENIYEAYKRENYT